MYGGTKPGQRGAAATVRSGVLSRFAYSDVLAARLPQNRSLLTYKVEIRGTAAYKLMIRNYHDNPDSTESNDCYLRVRSHPPLSSSCAQTTALLASLTYAYDPEYNDPEIQRILSRCIRAKCH